MNNPTITYEGKDHTLSEGISMVMRHMIEKDTPGVEGYNPNWNPYKYWELELGKSQGTIRKWVVDPANGGATPPLHLFLYMIYKTKSFYGLEFIKSLINTESSDWAFKQSEEMKSMVLMMREIADDLEKKSEHYNRISNQIELIKNNS